MDDSLQMRDALREFYAAHGLAPDGGVDKSYFFVHIGPLKIPLPNPPMRKRAVLFHDMHHLVAGYDTVFSHGEMIIAGFEIGAGCGGFFIAWLINLWMFALGLFIVPRSMFVAYVRGRHCQSLYHGPRDGEVLLDMTVSELKRRLRLDQPTPSARPADRVSFAIWTIVAWVVTLGCAAIASLAIWGAIAGLLWLVND